MKNKLRLSQMGLTTLEIDCIERLPAVFAEMGFLTDSDDESRKINSLIRQKYSISQELAILRQRDSKPDEYAEYNAYVEECKTKINN